MSADAAGEPSADRRADDSHRPLLAKQPTVMPMQGLRATASVAASITPARRRGGGRGWRAPGRCHLRGIWQDYSRRHVAASSYGRMTSALSRGVMADLSWRSPARHVAESPRLSRQRPRQHGCIIASSSSRVDSASSARRQQASVIRRPKSHERRGAIISRRRRRPLSSAARCRRLWRREASAHRQEGDFMSLGSIF